MQLGAGARILEIGCGWGGFAETALRAGHAVTGLTLSTEQLEYARERLAPLGAGWDLRLQDYREEHGQYDGIASIEMFEAVGEAYWPSYFATLKRCLAPRGRACVQTIVIADELFDRYRVGTDFIQQYIFPGGMLPSPSAFRAGGRARRPGRGRPACLRLRLRPHAGDVAASASTRSATPSARSASTSASSASGISTSPTARRRSPAAAPMWSSTRSRMRSAAFAVALALALPLAAPAKADVPSHVGRALGDARPAGSGRLTWFGLHVYDARLFVPRAGFDARRYAEHPFALELTYARKLNGRAIAERSDSEIERLGIGSARTARALAEGDDSALPGRAGRDSNSPASTCPGRGVDFYLDGRRLGGIDDPEFGAAFFAIWLDARTTAPELRAGLLKQAL